MFYRIRPGANARVDSEVALVNKIFWSIAAAEAVFFVILVVMTATQNGQNADGGKEMGIAFGGILPFLILAIACLIYWKTTSPALHVILLVAITIPSIWLAARWIREPFLARDSAAGGFIYEDPRGKRFVAAVAKLDQNKVRELAPTVDVNAVGQMGATPLKFAVDNVPSAGDAAAQLDMIRVLLAVGAKPDSALPNACRLNRGDATKVLLDAGANPNYKDDEGTPAFFYCPGDSGGLASLQLLAAKGADFNALDAKDVGALIHAATFSQWDTMFFFLDQGVKDTATLNGKNAAAMVRQAIEDDKQNSRETSPALRKLHAKLNN
jgi:hypothetical protein